MPKSLARRSWVFSAFGALALFAIAVGFGRTYLVPMSRGTFAAPTIVHVHGTFAMAWVLLFVVQPLLVRWRRLRWHRRLGWVGAPLALGVAVTMIPAGYHQVAREVAAGAGATGISAILGVLTSALLFVSLVAAGIIARRDRESHARWMLLATLVVIWPAWFRFRHYFPGVPRPDIWFAGVLAYVWIIVAMVHDRLTRGRVHSVLLWGGTFVIVEQMSETMAFDAPWWRAAAQALYDALAWMAVG
jgi:hypothetical protein